MTKYRKKPIVIEASQWFKNGDHPKDNIKGYDVKGEPFQKVGEGEIVRYYRTPECDGKERCKKCNNIMHIHGWIDTFEGGHIVCPSDWIITGIKGEYYPCKPDIFEQTYDLVE